VAGSRAHARMLATQGIISKVDLEAILKGLETAQAEIREGRFEFKRSLEDIHLNIESRLAELAGAAAGRLHTARSRNDQVALDVRLYLREEIEASRDLIRSLQRAILDLAEGHLDTIIPGYTHTQRAQPILLAHHLLAYWEMLQRDGERFSDCYRRGNVLPLGAGALAGVTFAVDPGYVARLLHFPEVANNSLDAVSDRDFSLEFLGAASILMMHLSRLSEEIVLWSSAEFGFIELPDSFATGSSMMPQKKNPDVPEIVRGKSGRVFGDLLSLLTTMKGLPLSYNRDLQEDKEPLFDAVDTVKACLKILSRMLPEIRIHPERMRQAAEEGFLNATDLADYLVGKGVPFRSAHEIVGKAVAYCLKKGRSRIEDLSLKELQCFSPLFSQEVFPFVSLEACVSRRRSPGGTSRERVTVALKNARHGMEDLR